MSIFYMAFHPVSVEVHRDLLFLSLNTATLFSVFFLSFAIILLLVRYLLRGMVLSFLFSLRWDILRVGIRRGLIGGKG
jgi:hypothetical protein